ncbi:MAG: hypothetical protein JWQ95_3183 [Sphaerisporangium sp.]|nr:hypothetical protein [Sphaerisporangium sp.]
MPLVDNLTQLAASVTKFAATASMTLVPAVPEHALGPEVCLGPETVDLPGFLALAHKLGGGVLYLRAAPFDPADDEHEVDEPPAHLAKCKGQIGQISVAFAANGLVHYWEHRTAWYAEWQHTAQQQSPRIDFLHLGQAPERLSPEERARLAAELTDTLLANPEFRAARGGARQRVAQLAIPPGTDQPDSWEAIRNACNRAEELGTLQYGQLADRLDELAVELLASPEYQQTSSASARKRIAERFLISRADGLSGPTYVREELYARAQQLAKASKTGKGSGGLF